MRTRISHPPPPYGTDGGLGKGEQQIEQGRRLDGERPADVGAVREFLEEPGLDPRASDRYGNRVDAIHPAAGSSWTRMSLGSECRRGQGSESLPRPDRLRSRNSYR